MPPFLMKRSGRIDYLETTLSGGCRVVVTTRRGGVSFGRGDLNLSFGTNDDRPAVAQNRDRLFMAIGCADVRAAVLRQRHSSKIVVIDEDTWDQAADGRIEGDSMITALPGRWLGVSVGDCLAVVIFDPVRRILAAVHAGWAGTALRNTQAALQN